jgi:hypothetical protein
LPDGNTLLGYRLEGGADSLRTWSFEPDPGVGHAGFRILDGMLEGEGALAQVSTRYAVDKPDHLRFFAFGHSSLEVLFPFPMRASSGDLVIELQHLAANRDLLPHQGRAALEVRLNGNLLDGELVVSSGSAHSARLVAGAGLLRTSLEAKSEIQRLELRLLESTTTTYWLSGLRVTWN